MNRSRRATNLCMLKENKRKEGFLVLEAIIKLLMLVVEQAFRGFFQSYITFTIHQYFY